MTATSISGYAPGDWQIDTVHSSITFTVRHLGVTKVRGYFGQVSGTITTAENPLDSRVSATIQAESIDTGHEQRDGHVKSEDFLDVANYPELSFTTTGLREQGEQLIINGELSIHGVTQPVELTAEVGGIGPGMEEGTTVIGLSATTTIRRSDFGVGGNIPATVVSDKVGVELDIEAVR